MNAYSQAGDVVFEPFAGSGSSLIAAERSGKHLRAIELAGAYVDLAIARWQHLFPDIDIVLDGDGRSYSEIAAERTGEERTQVGDEHAG
jgi:DNA modification methylase